ncbi:MAG: hypothetical protein RMK30_05610 [Anaerolineae bacterium]|nr:hypothetical protein [Anaerolineae bacterium]
MGRDEWLWTVTASVFIVILTTVPYLAGYLLSTPERAFTGAIYDLSDYNSHLAKMQQGYQGSWRWKLLFTSEPHEGKFVNLFYLSLGHLARALRLDLAWTYHLARLSGGILVLVLAYRFIALFLEEKEWRRTAFLMASLGSGLGWLLLPLFPPDLYPIDFWLSDFYLFFSIMAFPHFSFSISFMLAAWILLLRQKKGLGPLEALGAALSGLALTLIHPYMPLILNLVPALFWTIEAIAEGHIPFRKFAILGLMFLFQIPYVLYCYLLFTRDPVFSGWTSQNITLSPPPHYYLLGAGLVGLLALLGIFAPTVPFRKKAFPLLWAILTLALAYGPWNFQRRLTLGWMLPGSILASRGWHNVLEPLLPGALKEKARTLRFALVVFASVSNLVLIALALYNLVTGHPDSFYPVEVVKAVDWLGAHSAPEEITLSAYRTGNFIPARTGRRSFLGHEMETVDFARKKEVVQAFFGNLSGEEKCALLEGYSISFIFFGPYERAIGSLNPEELKCIERIYREGGVEIFRYLGR